jgi:hypothetical protein
MLMCMTYDPRIYDQMIRDMRRRSIAVALWRVNSLEKLIFHEIREEL